ncbi:hypothetical protein BH11BAC3_BH11BAC3_32730 [soil metagenome]
MFTNLMMQIIILKGKCLLMNQAGKGILISDKLILVPLDLHYFEIFSSHLFI